MGFVFYDTETTGLNTAFSQILQFAAIYTDDNLNEIDRFEIRSQILPHVVPAPQAMLTTGVTAKQLTEKTLPTYYQMLCSIKDKLRSWSPAIFVGYNSLGYDEPLLRQAFYQNLLPLYLTNTNGNSRADVLLMVQAVSVLMPELFQIPINDKQKPSFKLDRVAPLNGFAHKNAHDAVADVEATIYLCRIIKEKAPTIWNNFINFSYKQNVNDYALSEQVFSFSDFYYNVPYSWLVTTIGISKENSSEILVFDLASNPDELVYLTLEELTVQLKKSPKPVRCIKSNAFPILIDFIDAPDIAESKSLGIEELQRRASIISSNKELRDNLMAAFNLTKENDKEPSSYVEEQIYNSFISFDDQKLLSTFHTLDWNKRTAIIKQLKDERLKTLAKRLIYFESPHLLEESILKEHDIAIAKRLLASETTVPWLTLPKAIAEVETLLERTPSEKHDFLKEHREFLLERLGYFSGLSG